MKRIKFLFLLIFVTSCNQYLGKVTDDYNPSKEVTELFANTQSNANNEEVKLGDIIYPKFVKTNLIFENFVIDKIINIDKNSIVGFFNNKIFLSKDKIIYVIDSGDSKKNFELKLNLNKDEHILNFYEYKNAFYFLTNNSRVFALNDQKASMIIDYGIYTNIDPILSENMLIIISVFGGIYQINLEDYSLIKKTNLNPKLGMTIKSNTFEDQENLYYLFNSGTLITFDKENKEYFNNYILEDLNILSSLGVFNDLVDTPFSYNNHLYFLDRSGKIAAYNRLSSEILWELDINNTILDYLFSNNGNLIILTFDKVLILSEKGKLINSFKHYNEKPISIFITQENINLISEVGITSIDLNNNSENNIYKNKFFSNLDIYYQYQNIYLKDSKRFFKLSE